MPAPRARRASDALHVGRFLRPPRARHNGRAHRQSRIGPETKPDTGRCRRCAARRASAGARRGAGRCLASVIFSSGPLFGLQGSRSLAADGGTTGAPILTKILRSHDWIAGESLFEEGAAVGSMFKRKVAIGVAGTAVLAGAGGTYAATHGRRGRASGILDDAAKRLKSRRKRSTTRSRARSRTVSTPRSPRAASHGRRPTDQAAAPGGRRAPVLGGPNRAGPGVVLSAGPGSPRRQPLFGAFDAAARPGPVPRATSGRSQRGQVARAAGPGPQQVGGRPQEGDEDAARAKLDAAVKAKDLTQAQEDAMLKELDNHIDDLGEKDRSALSNARQGRPQVRGPPGDHAKGHCKGQSGLGRSSTAT